MCETALCDTITQDNVLGTFLAHVSFPTPYVMYQCILTNTNNLCGWCIFMIFNSHADLLVLADLHGASAVRGLALKVTL